jgi:O-methyltransferase
MTDLAAHYLNLVKTSVLGELYDENELRILYLRDCANRREIPDRAVLLDIARKRPEMAAEYRRERLVGRLYERTLKNLGYQHTMIGRARLEGLERCLETVVADAIPGDFIECGVWRGGACVFMRAFLKAREIRDRIVWLADSFAGLPPPTRREDAGLNLSAVTHPMLAVDEETVRDVFERYGLLDEQVRFLKGWFRDTLPKAPVERLAILRLDGDLYESTMDSLEALYDRVTPGGFVIVDDYGVIRACKQAVHDFRGRREIAEPLVMEDWSAAHWRKDG